MGVKRVLIIQTDDVYFLHETVQVLNTNAGDLNATQITILADPHAIELLKKSTSQLPQGITSDSDNVLKHSYDLCFNLSLNEDSWRLHEKVEASQKAGPYYEGNELKVNGIWSAWYLTFKGNTPFVTFHMREIFRNILGVKKKTPQHVRSNFPKTFIMGMPTPELFPNKEQEALLTGLARRFPGLQVMDESEVTLNHDHSSSLYIGPASMKSLLLAEAGASCIYFGSRFQGMNLLPEKENTFLLTTSGKMLDAQTLLLAIENALKETEHKLSPEFSFYRLSMENVFGAYLQRLDGEETSYPFYQVHLVLWNYLLSLQDFDLDIVPLSKSQSDLLTNQLEIVAKLVKLHEYAMISLDQLYREVKSPEANAEVIQKQMDTLNEIDVTLEKISSTNPYLRPVLDFYKIRKGQIAGETLLERSQNSLLTYTEEHQAFKALEELLLTLQKRK